MFGRKAEPEQQARSITLAGPPPTEVAYTLRRSARRTIGLTVDRHGLRVAAPRRARIGTIESMLQQHGAWVLAKLAEWRERQDIANPTLAVVDGLCLPWLGGQLLLRIQHAPAVRRVQSTWTVAEDQPILALRLPPEAAPGGPVRRSLQAAARQHFAARLAHYAQDMNLPEPPLGLSSARTRWGSCSSRGHIRLNWRLMFFPPAVVDYVVIHELAHLREMNHGPRFWSIVASLCPDWQHLRAELKRQAHLIPVFEE